MDWIDLLNLAHSTRLIGWEPIAKNKISNGNVHLLCGMWIMLGSNEHHLLHTWGK
jgi:hypothetical protein